MIPERRPFAPGDRFRDASRAYLVYGIVYWIGGAYLALQGVGVRGSMSTSGLTWIVLGLAFVIAIPYLLRRPRPWFERWVLSRRDFARILTVLMGVRAWHVLRSRRDGRSGGSVSRLRAGLPGQTQTNGGRSRIVHRPDAEHTDMGWEITPDGLHDLVKGQTVFDEALRVDADLLLLLDATPAINLGNSFDRPQLRLDDPIV